MGEAQEREVTFLRGAVDQISAGRERDRRRGKEAAVAHTSLDAIRPGREGSTNSPPLRTKAGQGGACHA